MPRLSPYLMFFSSLSCGHMVSGDKQAAELLQAVTYNVDERPLSVALEEVRPYFEDRESQDHGRWLLSWIQVVALIVIKINNCPGFFNHTSYPMQYALFTFCRKNWARQ